ncbi:uncharacterized protein LOC119889774 [Micropterus salmoides]|uniref:uncharacterized protein LOC119889774 n=1 Tax=Micropterus salmoides TaxID=27706 RepID=UPI0018ECD018|nr:uncharacterized protein LOC119889774 [Micropterus salmoides]
MEAASTHAASLLASLNLQRERGQFCDCVVTQRQSPSQLYPAHRCVLAASSPVLASILSSTGALVELKAPCLSDPVLALLLDYIYTGAFPHTHNQQQCYSLLTAACYLQMDELQEALRTWKHNEVNAGDYTNAYTEPENQPYEVINSTCSLNSPEGEGHQYSANVDTRDEIQMQTASKGFCMKDIEIDPCRSSSKNGKNCCGRKDASNISTCCGACQSAECSVNTGTCRQATSPQNLINKIPRTAKMHRVSRMDTEVQMDQFCSSGTVKPETWQKSAAEEVVRTGEDRSSLYLLCPAEVQEEETSRAELMGLTLKSKAEEKQTNREEDDKTRVHHSPLCLSTSHLRDNVSPSQCSSSYSSSPPQACCGAVPVIRHISRADMLRLAGGSTVPPFLPVSQATISSSGDPDSQLDKDSIVEGITPKHKGHTGTQSLDNKDRSNQFARQDLCYKSNADQLDILKQDYNSSNTDQDEHMGNGLSHITGHTKHFRDDSFPVNKDYHSFTRGLKYRTDLSFDDFASKQQRLDFSDCCIVSMETAAEEQSIYSQDQRAVVSLPEQDSDTGSDSHRQDLCPEGQVKDKHSYSSGCQAEMDGQDRQCSLFGPKTDWYPHLHRVKTNTNDAASCQHERDPNNKDTAMTDKRYRTDVYLSVSSTPQSCLDDVSGGFFAFKHCTPLELEKTSGTETTEPHFTFTIPVDNNMSGPTYSAVGQSYRGQLHYHCLPQENIHLSHGDSEHHYSHPSHLDQSGQSSDDDDDDDDDDEQVGTFAIQAQSPLSQHFATGTTDQVVLLDISAKPAELLASYKPRSDEGEKRDALGHKDTFGNRFGQWNEATSVAGVDSRNITAWTKCGAESLDEARSKSWGAETNVKERKSVGKEQSKSGAHIKHKAGVVEGKNQTTTLTVCSPPSVPDSVQASVSSTLSVSIPSTLSASLPTNISAHLSTPVHHHLQCSLCDRSFSQRGSLNRHVRSHLGVRPFPCPRCPMTFSRQYRVTEHMRVHQRCVLGSDFQKPPTTSI